MTVTLANQIITFVPDFDLARSSDIAGWGICLSLTIVFAGLAIRRYSQGGYRLTDFVLRLGCLPLIFGTLFFATRPKAREVNERLAELKKQQEMEKTKEDSGSVDRESLNTMYASVVDRLLEYLSLKQTCADLELDGVCKICLIKSTYSMNWPDDFIQEQSVRLQCIDESIFFDDDPQIRTVGIRLDRYNPNTIDPFFGNMRVVLFARGGKKPYKKEAAYLRVEKTQERYDVEILTLGD